MGAQRSTLIIRPDNPIAILSGPCLSHHAPPHGPEFIDGAPDSAQGMPLRAQAPNTPIKCRAKPAVSGQHVAHAASRPIAQPWCRTAVSRLSEPAEARQDQVVCQKAQGLYMFTMRRHRHLCSDHDFCRFCCFFPPRVRVGLWFSLGQRVELVAKMAAIAWCSWRFWLLMSRDDVER